MESVEHVDVDEVWKTLGKFGRYQLVQLIVLILAALPMAFHTLSVVFLGKHIDHVCSFSPEADGNHNSSVVLDSCNIQIVTNTSNGTDVTEYACSNGYNYTGDILSSFVTEWDLVCERDALGKLSQTLVMVGMFLGASFLPSIADRFGRKRLHTLSECSARLSGILDESVRWLVANNRTKEAIKIVKKACKVNHKDFDSVWKTIQERSNAIAVFNQTKDKERTALLNEPDLSSTIDSSPVFTADDGKQTNGAVRLSFLDLLKNRTLRPLTLIISYACCINATTYYGLALLSTTLAGDPYVNFLLGGVLEIPAAYLAVDSTREISITYP